MKRKEFLITQREREDDGEGTQGQMLREILIPTGSTLVASDEDEEGTGQQSLEIVHVSRQRRRIINL